jgi:hypothetical protein
MPCWVRGVEQRWQRQYIAHRKSIANRNFQINHCVLNSKIQLRKHPNFGIECRRQFFNFFSRQTTLIAKHVVFRVCVCIPLPDPLPPCRTRLSADATAVATSGDDAMGGGGGGGIPKPKVSIDRLELLARRERGEPLDFGNLSSSVSSASAASASSSSSTSAAYLNHFGHAFQQLQNADRFALRPPRPHGTEPFYAFTVCVENRLRNFQCLDCFPRFNIFYFSA